MSQILKKIHTFLDQDNVKLMTSPSTIIGKNSKCRHCLCCCTPSDPQPYISHMYQMLPVSRRSILKILVSVSKSVPVLKLSNLCILPFSLPFMSFQANYMLLYLTLLSAIPLQCLPSHLVFKTPLNVSSHIWLSLLCHIQF